MVRLSCMNYVLYMHVTNTPDTRVWDSKLARNFFPYTLLLAVVVTCDRL